MPDPASSNTPHRSRGPSREVTETGDGPPCDTWAMNLAAFQATWTGVTLTERSASQSHFLDLCALFGVPAPVAADPTGVWFTFEKGATRWRPRSSG